MSYVFKSIRGQVWRTSPVAWSTIWIPLEEPPLTVMIDEVVEARWACDPKTSNDSDDMAFHVYETHITAIIGFFLSKVVGVDAKRAMAGPVRGGEVRAIDKLVPRTPLRGIRTGRRTSPASWRGHRRWCHLVSARRGLSTFVVGVIHASSSPWFWFVG